MDYGHGSKMKMSDNINIERADRLSSLPDDMIHKILSCISIKDTVKTIAWSSRYRFIWTTMPYLNFSAEDFPWLDSQKFSKFVKRFLSRRDSRVDVSSLKLSFHGKVTQPFVKKLMDYAFSHNIQQLDVVCLLHSNIEFPLSLLSSQSLKHLCLKVESNGYDLKATSTLGLPGLTTLYLQDVIFCSDDNFVRLLSKCANLKNLTLKSCKTDRSSSFGICHPGLCNLTLDVTGLYHFVKVVNVVAPQLENLSIRCNDDYSSKEHMIFAPNLASLAYRGDHPLHLSTHGFPSLKEANISVIRPKVADAHQMVCLLQQLHNVEFLTLNLDIIELISSSVELISHQPSPFVNLKSLTIYPEKLSEWETRGLPKGKDSVSSEVKNYMLDSSPGATFTMYSREEIIAEKNAASNQASARKLMTELQVLLEKEKANIETKRKAPMESDNVKMHKKRKAQPEKKMQLQSGGNITLIKSCWKDLSVQFEQRKAKACLIISMLEGIEGLLKKLPASNRAMIQPCFFSLCAEADLVMRKIMKMLCDENQSRVSVCFHELATSTTMEPSS